MVGNSTTQSIGEWLESIGKSPYMEGPWGQVDMRQFQGAIDYSEIKNKPLYQTMVGLGYDPNEVLTQMIQLTGMSEILTEDNAMHGVNALRQQQTSFMFLSPELMQQHTESYVKKMRQLRTPAGIRQLLGNTIFGKELEAGRIDISDPAIDEIVKDEERALLASFSRGELIDESGKRIKNQMLAKNPLVAVLQSEGKTVDQMTSELQQLVEKKTGRKYSTDEIQGMFALKQGAIVDFANPNQKNVAVQRSPSLFNQFVYGQNYADIAKDVYDAFGISTSGLYLSMEDMQRLDADWDGDQVKTMYAEYAEAIRKTNEIQQRAIAELRARGINTDNLNITQALSEEQQKALGLKMSGAHLRLLSEAGLDQTMPMGSFSGAGERAAMMGATQRGIGSLMAAQLQSIVAYGEAAAGLKHATKISP